ncbi:MULTISPECIES: hypothetical protein [Fischerella]|nr:MULTISPECIES: hypothetical protein [Fischerella]
MIKALILNLITKTQEELDMLAAAIFFASYAVISTLFISAVE